MNIPPNYRLRHSFTPMYRLSFLALRTGENFQGNYLFGLDSALGNFPRPQRNFLIDLNIYQETHEGGRNQTKNSKEAAPPWKILGTSGNFLPLGVPAFKKRGVLQALVAHGGAKLNQDVGGGDAARNGHLE